MQLTSEDRDLIRRTLLQGDGFKATAEEEEIFFRQIERTGLDPFNKQIYALFRWDNKARRKTMQIQTSVDGLRLVAERTGQYGGGTCEQWCGPDGQWTDVWLSKDPPAGAKAGVYKKGYQAPTYAVATFEEYAQRDRNHQLQGMWKNMPARMLLKCAESLALRKAFPQELSGLYTSEEMGQAEQAPEPQVAPVEAPPLASSSPGGADSPQTPRGPGSLTEIPGRQSETPPAPAPEPLLATADQKAELLARIEALPGTWKARISEAWKAEGIHSLRGKLFQVDEIGVAEALIKQFEERWERIKAVNTQAREVVTGEVGQSEAVVAHATEGRTQALRDCTMPELDQVLAVLGELKEGAVLLVPEEQGERWLVKKK